MEQIIIFDGGIMMRELQQAAKDRGARGQSRDDPETADGNALAVQRANDWLASMNDKINILNRQIGVCADQIVITVWYRTFAK